MGSALGISETQGGTVNPVSWDELNSVFALSYAAEIRAVVDQGDRVLRRHVEGWEPAPALGDHDGPR
jgi:hypothetical protein